MNVIGNTSNKINAIRPRKLHKMRMKLNMVLILITVLTGLVSVKAGASVNRRSVNQHQASDISADTIKRGAYTLIFINKDTMFARLGSVVKHRMIDAFFDVYPREAKAFNKNTIGKVVFIIDPAYDGVAATDNGQVTYSPSWMLQQPTDLDVVTHELMHIVQDYGENVGPGWLTEGIADYVRYVFGVDNSGARWALPPFSSGQNYDNSYRITARFLAWIEKNVKPGTVKYLDHQMRSHTYSDDSWKKYTGAGIDELWRRYVAAPSI